MINKILITNMYAGFGGGERCIQDHIQFLKQSGIACDLLLLEKGEFREIAIEAGANVTEIPFQWQGSKLRSLFHIAQRILRYRSYLKSRQPDLHIAYTLNDLILVGFAARSLRIPVVYRAQADVFGKASSIPKTWLGNLLLPLLNYISPLFICTTSYERENLVQLGFPANKVIHIPLGVNLDNFRENPVADDKLRAELGFSDRPIVAMFGRLARWKGQKYFISALLELKKRGIHVCAWIIGDASFGDGDKYAEELKLLARELGTQGEIKFLGFRSDVSNLMSACDIVCHASDSEPFGMVIIEAMALARPVVASNVSGPRESIIDGETGFLFPAGNDKCMADKLAQLLSDEELRTRMGLAGQKRIQSHFDLAKNLRHLHGACERYNKKRY